MEETKPSIFFGYSILNKPVFFKGGLPAMLVMMIITIMIITTMILMSLINILYSLTLVICIMFFLGKWASKIAVENRKGDRDYMKSMNAFSQAPKEIRDNGFLEKVMTSDSTLFKL